MLRILPELLVFLLMVALTIMGVYVSLKPPRKERHWVWLVCFITVGLIACGAYGWQLVRTERRADEDRKVLLGQIKELSKTAIATGEVVKTIAEQTRTPVSDVKPSPITRVVITGQPAQHPIPTPTATPTEPAAIQSELRASQKRVDSQYPEAPYGLQVIIQTNVPIQPTGLLVHCNGEIYKGQFFVAGQPVMMSVGEGWKGSDYQLQFGSPPFTPQSPVVVTLFSKSPIKVIGVNRIRL